MIEKIGPIKNPLTIIAIFAAIVEISGTGVLPFITSANQATYLWFLIVFPILLILLFFLTLNFNHKVLYAPSDYQNEENFLRSLPKATLVESFLKIEAKIAEEETATEGLPQPEKVPAKAVEAAAPSIQGRQISFQGHLPRGIEVTYMLAEELIFRKLSNTFSAEIQRDVKVGSPQMRYIFDGIVQVRGITTIIAAKFLRSALTSMAQLQVTLAQIQRNVKLLPPEQTANFRVLLALAFDESTPIHEPERFAAHIGYLQLEFPFPIDVRFYNLAELQHEFNIGV